MRLFNALLIAAADGALVARVITEMRKIAPGVHITAITRVGAVIKADICLTVPTRGPFGFSLGPAQLFTLLRHYDIAWAVVGVLDSPAYRRVALLLSLARAREKTIIGPNLEMLRLHEWCDRAGISLGVGPLLRAGLRRLTTPYRHRKAYRLLDKSRPPWGFRRINIGVSDRCNQRCLMCSEHSPFCDDSGRRMAAAEVQNERDFGLLSPEAYTALLRDLVQMGTREIELCGLGEPLLHPRLLDFVQEAKQAGLWVRLVTNASLLDDRKAEVLVSLELDELQVSINAATPESYAQIHGVTSSVFERVLSAVKTISDAKHAAGGERPVIETSFVVQASNYREPPLWARLMAEMGANILTFSALGAAPTGAPVNLAEEQLEQAKFLVAEACDWSKSQGLQVRGTFQALGDEGTSFSADLYAHIPCYIGYIFSLVTADGRIHPCCACERVVGDLREGGFTAAWQSERYRRFRQEALDLPIRQTQERRNQPPGLEGCSCMSCPYGPWNIEFHRRLYKL